MMRGEAVGPRWCGRAAPVSLKGLSGSDDGSACRQVSLDLTHPLNHSLPVRMSVTGIPLCVC